MEENMHKQTIRKMCEVANVVYEKSLDPDCRSWFIWDSYDVEKMPDWVPGWANGIEPEALYEWMLEQSAVNADINLAMKAGGMRTRRLTTLAVDGERSSI